MMEDDKSGRDNQHLIGKSFEMTTEESEDFLDKFMKPCSVKFSDMKPGPVKFGSISRIDYDENFGKIVRERLK